MQQIKKKKKKIAALTTDPNSKNFENSQRFFNHPVVQRKLIKALLDGTITNPNIINGLRECTPCIAEKDQIAIISSRRRLQHIDQTDHMELVLRFLDQVKNHRNFPENWRATAKPEPEQTTIVSQQNNSVQDEYTIIGKYVDYAMQNILYFWDTFDAFCNQENPITNEELATAIVENSYWRAEKNKLENILASPEERMAFFNESSVQMILLRGWTNGVDIDPRVLIALQDCTPKLSLRDQTSIVKLPAYSSLSSDKKALLHPFLADDPSVQMILVRGWIEAIDSHPRVLAALQRCTPNLSTVDQDNIVESINYSLIPSHKKELLLPFLTNNSQIQMTLLELLATGLDMDPGALTALQNCIPNLYPVQQNKITILLSTSWDLPTINKVIPIRFINNISPDYQQWLARQLGFGLAGNDPIVLQAWAKKLEIFTNPQAQIMITDAIRRGKFGNNPLVIQTLANEVEKLTHPKAKENIARAIREEKFGENQVIRKKLLTDSMRKIMSPLYLPE